MSVERRTPLSPFFKFSSMNREIYSGDFSLRLMKVSKAWPKGLPDDLSQARMCRYLVQPTLEITIALERLAPHRVELVFEV